MYMGQVCGLSWLIELRWTWFIRKRCWTTQWRTLLFRWSLVWCPFRFLCDILVRLYLFVCHATWPHLGLRALVFVCLVRPQWLPEWRFHIRYALLIDVASMESVFKRSRNSNNVAPVQPNMLEVDINALASILSPDSRQQGTASANDFEHLQWGSTIWFVVESDFPWTGHSKLTILQLPVWESQIIVAIDAFVSFEPNRGLLSNLQQCAKSSPLQNLRILWMNFWQFNGVVLIKSNL